MTVGSLILIAEPLLLLIGFFYLVSMMLQKKAVISRPVRRDDPSSDDEGGIPIDWDAPLDLPPGVFVMPPTPEPVGK